MFANGYSRGFILCLCLFSFQFAGAQEADSGSSETTSAQANAPKQYYTFAESDVASDGPSWITPQQWLQETLSMVAQSDTLTLLKWVLHDTTPPEPTEPYKRLKHFGSWKGDPSHSTCYNTRARVLIRDSEKTVTFGSNPCVVTGGLWKDPYTGELIESSRQMQIDHVVPLKNAYISGASSWTPQARCTYANFTANPHHLLSVSGHENMKKGDDAPDQYLPPDDSYICTYLQEWLQVKMTWRLFMSPQEVQAITLALKNHNCQAEQMVLGKSDLQGWRHDMLDSGACATFTGESRKVTPAPGPDPAPNPTPTPVPTPAP